MALISEDKPTDGRPEVTQRKWRGRMMPKVQIMCAAPQPGTASTPSPGPQPGPPRTSSRLTPSEIESLRKDSTEASERIKAMMRSQK
ncbi:hypothetical protein V5F44_19450 [Xanthobacter sp. V2C-8]|uniref:hypothetical protein n=1 Tax=Xanthobacter albus TaxID=3119929 RepID=UPI00372BEFAF